MPFTTHDKLGFSLRGREKTSYVLFMVDDFICAGGEKNTKVSERGRSFTIEGFGKFGKVVLTRWMPRNAIRVRFEEGWR